MLAPDVGPFFRVIDRLYAAACDPAEWQSFLAATASMFDATNAYVSQIEHDRRTLDYVVLRQVNWDAISVSRYAALMDEDPRMPAFRSHPLRAQHCRMVVSENELHASRAYVQALKPLGIEYTLVVGIPEREGVTNYLGLTRDPSGDAFDTADCELLQELVPHLARAFAVRRSLGGAPVFTAASIRAIPCKEAAADQAATTLADQYHRRNEDQYTPRSEIDGMRLSFGLSPRQAKLASLLLSGRSVKEAAYALSITEGSARQYLKVIFRKTGACRQSDLIRIVHSALAS